jgi:hypothetical protein
MLRRRTRISLLIVLALLVLLALAVVLRMKAPPEAARLLPESDAIVYLDLKPLRAATHFDPNAPPIDRDPGYQHFLDATGFNWERDLDEVAIALHQMPDPNGPNGPVAFSAVFQGRIDRRQMEPYLTSLSTGTENYAGQDIFIIPSEDRTVRVTFLGYDMVATSNMPTSEQIHSIIDRYRTAALASSGSSLLDERYGDVPLLSFAWGIGRLGLPFAIHPPHTADPGQIQLKGLTLPVPADATFVASIGLEENIAAAIEHTGALHVHLEEITPDASTAAATAQTLQTIVDIYRGLQPALQQSSSPPSKDDAALQQSIRSLRIDHHSNRVILTGSASADLVRSIFSPAVADATDSPASPSTH